MFLKELLRKCSTSNLPEHFESKIGFIIQCASKAVRIKAQLFTDGCEMKSLGEAFISLQPLLDELDVLCRL